MGDARGPQHSGKVPVHYFAKRVGRISSTDATSSAPTLPISREDLLRALASRGPSEAEPRPRPAKAAKGARKGPRRTMTPIVIDPHPALQYHRQKVQALLTGTASKGSIDPTELAEMSLRGHRLFEEGQLDKAREVFEAIVRFDVEDAFPHVMLGTICLAQGQPDRALAALEAALERDPSDLASRVYRAEIRLSQGKVKQAMRDLAWAKEHGRAGDPFLERAKALTDIAERRQRKGKRDRSS